VGHTQVEVDVLRAIDRVTQGVRTSGYVRDSHLAAPAATNDDQGVRRLHVLAKESQLSSAH
jgi:hypothetical protein